MANDESFFDVLCVGELYVDFVSTEPVRQLETAETFRIHTGGGCANIAVYVGKLWGNSMITAKVGEDFLGRFLVRDLENNEVNIDNVFFHPDAATSIVFHAKFGDIFDLEAYRSSDFRLRAGDVDEEMIENTKIVHSSGFALSMEPCRSAVKKAFHLAKKMKKNVSFDPGHPLKTWPYRDEAINEIKDIYQYVTITRATLSDAAELFGQGFEPAEYAEKLHKIGPETVVLDLRDEGWLVTHGNQFIEHVEKRPVAAADTRNAEDAFWAGFLMAYLDNNHPITCAYFAREIREMKLGTPGRIQTSINRREVYERLPAEVRV
jgi:fructokinase